MTTFKKIGVPAVPTNANPEMYQFLSAVRQTLAQYEALITENAAALDLCAKSFSGYVYANKVVTSGAFVAIPKNGFLQYVMNNGAFTWVPPTDNCSMTILLQNGPSAGAITTSNFTKVTGSSFVTTTQYLFACRITVIGGKSWMEVQALQ